MDSYVGNLSLEMTEDEPHKESIEFGDVLSVTIANDNYIDSGQLHGYGFVEMTSKSEDESTTIVLNGKSLKHWTIGVIQTLPLSDNKDKGFLHARSISHFSGRGRKRRY